MVSEDSGDEEVAPPGIQFVDSDVDDQIVVEVGGGNHAEPPALPAAPAFAYQPPLPAGDAGDPLLLPALGVPPPPPLLQGGPGQGPYQHVYKPQILAHQQGQPGAVQQQAAPQQLQPLAFQQPQAGPLFQPGQVQLIPRGYATGW